MLYFYVPESKIINVTRVYRNGFNIVVDILLTEYGKEIPVSWQLHPDYINNYFIKI